MTTVCLYFQVHQPYRLGIYRFFDIGQHTHYYHEVNNRLLMQRIAKKCYLPMNNLILRLIQDFEGAFQVAYSISGSALDQMEAYAPAVLESFQALVATGCVELLAETYSHSLASLVSMQEFERQVHLHNEKIRHLFGYTPKVFRNTELIYSDSIAEKVTQMGYEGMLAEGTEILLGWRSPNYIYLSRDGNLRLLLRNYRLSDDIAFRFSNSSWEAYPLTAEKYLAWLEQIPSQEVGVNLFMDYETFGEHQWAESGIFEFFETWVRRGAKEKRLRFMKPSEMIHLDRAVARLSAPQPLSWADTERDLTAWLGNDMQQDAFQSLYALEKAFAQLPPTHPLQQDWLRLQTSDHFYYMCTKFFSDGDVHKYFNPYHSPYEAYITYMNVLSDIKLRLEQEGVSAEESTTPPQSKVN
ncbi:MAG: glycoside hydrolase family 57 protein [Bacteroidia bacterium]